MSPALMLTWQSLRRVKALLCIHHVINTALSCNGGMQFKYPLGEYKPKRGLFEKNSKTKLKIIYNIIYV